MSRKEWREFGPLAVIHWKRTKNPRKELKISKLVHGCEDPGVEGGTEMNEWMNELMNERM